MDILDIFVILLYCSEVSYERDEQFGDSEETKRSVFASCEDKQRLHL